MFESQKELKQMKKLRLFKFVKDRLVVPFVPYSSDVLFSKIKNGKFKNTDINALEINLQDSAVLNSSLDILSKLKQ